MCPPVHGWRDDDDRPSRNDTIESTASSIITADAHRQTLAQRLLGDGAPRTLAQVNEYTMQRQPLTAFNPTGLLGELDIAFYTLFKKTYTTLRWKNRGMIVFWCMFFIISVPGIVSGLLALMPWLATSGIGTLIAAGVLLYRWFTFDETHIKPADHKQLVVYDFHKVADNPAIPVEILELALALQSRLAVSGELAVQAVIVSRYDPLYAHKDHARDDFSHGALAIGKRNSGITSQRTYFAVW